MTWQLQEAKNKFSEVVDTSVKNGPQIISRRGRNTAVVISFEDYRRYIAPEPKLNFKEWLMQAPVADLEIKRDQTLTGRGTEFVFE